MDERLLKCIIEICASRPAQVPEANTFGVVESQIVMQLQTWTPISLEKKLRHTLQYNYRTRVGTKTIWIVGDGDGGSEFGVSY